MKSRLFNEDVRIESKYNIIPQGMRRNQRAICAGCEYRLCGLQYDVACDEAQRRGGSPRTYLGGFCMQSAPVCKRERCLVSTFVLVRGAKAPSSFKKIIKPANITKLNKELK